LGAILAAGSLASSPLAHAYASDDEDIYVMNADGSGATPLVVGSADDEDPVFSPDGTKIAFESNRDGNREIYVMNADGSEQTRLTEDPASDTSPAWSPDGSQIAFTSARDGNLQVYVMAADGSGETRVTDGSGDDSSPAWSPDGSQIAFVTGTPGATAVDIAVMNVEGGDEILVTHTGSIKNDPTWSPDGRISFSDGTIMAVNPDGSGLVPVTSSGGRFSPAWSWDGSRVAFAYTLDGVNREIHVANADGSGEVALEPGIPGHEDAPSFSPDGSMIAYSYHAS
jgi:TolB protein